MTVTFCGHRYVHSEDKEKIESFLHSEIEKLIADGADTFLLGGYGEFDYMCAKAAKKLKEKYPHITSVIVIPYIDREYGKELYDYSEYPPIETVPKKFAITARNKYMVQKADAVIAYVLYRGGAYDTLEYAKRRKKFIIQI